MLLLLLLLVLVCDASIIRPQFTIKVMLSDTNIANLTDLTPTFSTSAIELRAESGTNACTPRVIVRAYVLRAWTADIQIAAVAKPVCAQVPTEAFENDGYRYEYMCVSLWRCG